MLVQKKRGGERRRLGFVMKRGLGGGAPFLLFKGGRRAMGGGVLVGLPSLAGGLGRGEESSSAMNPCLAPLGFFDPFLGFQANSKKSSRTFQNILKHSRISIQTLRNIS